MASRELLASRTGRCRWVEGREGVGPPGRQPQPGPAGPALWPRQGERARLEQVRGKLQPAGAGARRGRRAPLCARSCHAQGSVQSMTLAEYIGRWRRTKAAGEPGSLYLKGLALCGGGTRVQGPARAAVPRRTARWPGRAAPAGRRRTRSPALPGRTGSTTTLTPGGRLQSLQVRQGRLTALLRAGRCLAGAAAGSTCACTAG